MQRTGDDEITALHFEDLQTEGEFDKVGLGAEGALLYPLTRGQQVFYDRVLLRKLLLTGKSAMPLGKAVDVYSLYDDRKRKRPTVPDTRKVLEEAFKKYPRLGTYDPKGGDKEIQFKSWPRSKKGETLFHNELMQCCRVSLRDLSKKRASFHDGQPPKITDEHVSAGSSVPPNSTPDVVPPTVPGVIGGQPITPPGGLGRVE